MLYYSTLTLIHGGPAIGLADKYSALIGQCFHMTMPRGRLDILVLATPHSLIEMERIVRTLYEIARNEALKQGEQSKGVAVTVLVDGMDVDQNRQQCWEVVASARFEMDLPKIFRHLVPDTSVIQMLPVVFLGGPGPAANPKTRYDEESLKMQEEYEERKEIDLLENGELMMKRTPEHGVVAVGGTFDHLHEGHKILLTTAGYLARDLLIVGITGPELLKNKEYAQAMESYAHRKESVESFLNYVYPSLQLHIEMMHDVYGPTATIENIDALVISTETRSGGEQVNQFRMEKKWSELTIYEVNLIGSGKSDQKISSTQLRKEELERQTTSAPTITTTVAK
jgi:pantetheine-phosphate adenylyltransferase